MARTFVQALLWMLKIDFEVNEGCVLMANGLYLVKAKARPVHPCQA
jgi:hypothetical protein